VENPTTCQGFVCSGQPYSSTFGSDTTKHGLHVVEYCITHYRAALENERRYFHTIKTHTVRTHRHTQNFYSRHHKRPDKPTRGKISVETATKNIRTTRITCVLILIIELVVTSCNVQASGDGIAPKQTNKIPTPH
jgi:hypothetical protein